MGGVEAIRSLAEEGGTTWHQQPPPTCTFPLTLCTPSAVNMSSEQTYIMIKYVKILLLCKHELTASSQARRCPARFASPFFLLRPDLTLHLRLAGLTGEIIARFEKRGYKLVALKMVHATVEHLELHYADLKAKSFFPGLVKYMASGACGPFIRRTIGADVVWIAGPVVAMVWEGKDAVKTGRTILGAFFLFSLSWELADDVPVLCSVLLVPLPPTCRVHQPVTTLLQLPTPSSPPTTRNLQAPPTPSPPPPGPVRSLPIPRRPCS